MVAGDLTPLSQSEMPPCDATAPEEELYTTTSESPTAGIITEVDTYSGPLVVIKVKDLLGITIGGGVHQFVYPPMVTLKQFINDVSGKFQTPVDEIELIYQCSLGMLEFCKMPSDCTLEGANMPGDREKVYAVSIQKSKAKKKPAARNSSANDFENSKDEEVNISTESRRLSANADGSVAAVREFVGLKNMTMTCYLNSVVQSLWFTPELRNALYKFNGDEILQTKSKSIVRSLKRLFLLLQLSVRDSIGTEELTQCFGWKTEDVWIQQDIEELFRILSDELSKELKGSEMEGLFSSLFGVLFADFISCKVCGKSREREDFQLGIPLPIRNFGVPLNTPALEEAIESYVSTELLTGNNQVNCDSCKERTDAVKGLCFKKLPYLLMFHLKRYEYDFERQTRAKINDKIEFPIILNMNRFDGKKCENEKVEEAQPVTPECNIPSLNPEWFVTPDQGQRRTCHSRKSVKITDTQGSSHVGEVSAAAANVDESSSAGVACGYGIPAQAQEYLDTCGPHVYHLYSVLTHRGILTGGHYFAFIFDFESSNWYRCDDTKVMRVPESDLTAAYGGEGAFTKEGRSEVGTAYMLLYRKIDQQMNSMPLFFEHIPEHTQAMWQKMIEEDRAARMKDEVNRTVVRIQVNFRPKGAVNLLAKEIEFPRSFKLKQAAMMSFKQFCPEGGATNGDKVRLVKFDRDSKVIDYNWKDDELQMDTVFPFNKCDDAKPNSVLLEHRESSEEPWETYKASDTIFLCHQMNYEAGTISHVSELHITENDTIKVLKEKIVTKISQLNSDDLRLFCLSVKHHLMQLADEEELVGHLPLGKVNDLFFEHVTDDQVDKLKHFLEIYTESICFNLLLPQQTTSVLELCTADSCAEKESSDLAPAPSKEDNACKAKATYVCLKNVERTIIPSLSADKRIEQGAALVLKNSQDSSVKKYFLHICGENLSDDPQWKSLFVRAERNLSLSCLSRLVGRLSGLEEKEFGFYTMNKDEETEVTNYSEDISDLSHFTGIRARPGKRMSPDEARIEIFMLFPENEEQPMKYLDQLIVHKSQKVDEVRKIIAKECEPITKISDPECYRLRRKVGNNAGKVMKTDSIFFDYCKRLYGAEAYVQMVSSPETWTANHYAFFVRLWSPDTYTVAGLKEFVVYHDYTKDSEELIAETISAFYEIPLEFLQLARITGDYPYKMTPYGITESVTWFRVPREAAKLSLLSDDMCLLVMDGRKIVKELTVDEQELYKKRHEEEQHEETEVKIELKVNRRETGLKIHTEN